MRTSQVGTIVGIILAGSAAASASAHGADSADAVDGRWDASLLNNGPAVSFRLDIAGAGPTLKATFYDGFRPYDATTSASFHDGKLVLSAEHYLTTITANLQGGELTGPTVLQGPGYSLKYDFHAVRHVESVATAVNAPSIAGSWEIPLEAPSAKGEKAFRFIVEQHGAEVAASILRVDGDTVGARQRREHYTARRCKYWVFEEAGLPGAFIEFAESEDQAALSAALAGAPEPVIDPARLYQEVEL